MADVEFDRTMLQGMKVTAPKPAKHSVTEENFQTLTSNVDTLFAVIGELEERISPILVEDFPRESTDTRGYSTPTGVSQRLANLCSRTDDLIERVRYVVSRIDL